MLYTAFVRHTHDCNGEERQRALLAPSVMCVRPRKWHGHCWFAQAGREATHSGHPRTRVTRTNSLQQKLAPLSPVPFTVRPWTMLVMHAGWEETRAADCVSRVNRFPARHAQGTRASFLTCQIVATAGSSVAARPYPGQSGTKLQDIAVHHWHAACAECA